MAKRQKKVSKLDLLGGHTITVVARKKGENERCNDLEYTEALKAKKKFESLGWSVALYQKGFYQPFNKSKYFQK